MHQQSSSYSVRLPYSAQTTGRWLNYCRLMGPETLLRVRLTAFPLCTKELLNKPSPVHIRPLLLPESKISAHKLLTNHKHRPLFHFLQSSDKFVRIWLWYGNGSISYLCPNTSCLPSDLF
jgi:hypothetical protein